MEELNDAQKVLETDIFDILGNPDIDDGNKAELLRKMLDTIRNRTVERILDLLSDDERQEWEKLLDAKDDIRTNQFLMSRNINSQEMMIEETIKYKLEVKNLVDYLKQSGKSFQEIQGEIDKIGDNKNSNA